MLDTSIGELVVNREANFVGSAHRDSRLIYHDPIAIEVLTNAARNSENMSQISRPILIGRRSDGDQNNQTVRYALGSTC